MGDQLITMQYNYMSEVAYAQKKEKKALVTHFVAKQKINYNKQKITAL